MSGRSTKVYLAGRIERDRYRYGLVDCTLDFYGDDDPSVCDQIPIHKYFDFAGREFEYTGPYTVGCDHGCAHNYDHAAGPGCFGDDTPGYQAMPGVSMRDKVRAVVVSRSLLGIAHADFVYAWLGCGDAFGTLVEIGYAIGLGKPVYVAHAKYPELDEQWFPLAMAKASFFAKSASAGFARACQEYFQREAARPREYVPWN